MLFRHAKLRAGQMELANDILDTVSNRKVGFFEAPTGLGKTDASISSILQYAIDNNKRLIFVTPKNSQHKIVVDVIKGINKVNNMKIRVIDFVSKSQMCSDPFLYNSGSEFYDLCDRKATKGMCLGYNNTVGRNKDQKLNAEINVSDFKSNYFDITSSDMRDACLNEPIMCPYELSLLIGKDANVIILDVNHIFVPSIRQKLFSKLKIDLEDCIFIFDEAHNLPSRIRNIQSISLSQSTISNAIKELQRVDKNIVDEKLPEFINELNLKMSGLKEGYVDYNFFDDLFSRYNYDYIIDNMSKISTYIIDNMDKRSNFVLVSNFFDNWYSGRESKSRFADSYGSLQIKSLDPGELASEVVNNSHSSIFMSATLTPFDMYSTLLKVKKEMVQKRYISPFPKENRLVLYSDTITTKYEERAKNMPEIASTITETINNISGNIAVFFPSYEMLNQILIKVENKTMKKIFVQNPKHNSIQSSKLIEDFKKMKNTLGGVLFAVVGGSFSEGVDFPGDDLIGIIVVGLPFPEPDYEVRALIDYYQKLYNAGWDYAYIYPTIAKIIQASGRPIRTETDRAFIMLLDKRYIWTKYQSLFPKDFEFKKYDIQKIIDFFKMKIN